MWCTKVYASLLCHLHPLLRIRGYTYYFFSHFITPFTLAVGVFEMEAFSEGTFAIARTLAELTDKVVWVE